MADDKIDPAKVKERRQQRLNQRLQRADERRNAIRGHLDRLGLSIKAACDLADLEHATHVSNFLTGRSRTLSLETAEPLAHGLNMIVSELIGERPSPERGSVDNDEVIIERDGLRIIIKTRDSEKLVRSLLGDVEAFTKKKKPTSDDS